MKSDMIFAAAMAVFMWFHTSVTALLVREEMSTEEGVLLSPGSSSTKDVCTAISYHQMTCNPDPLVLYQKAGYSAEPLHGHLDLGVKQRIDGNEAEIEGIKKVIKLMNQYFLDEVLSIYEYAFIVPKCKNYNELCAFWTHVGECESNRKFMIPTCAAACRFCLLSAHQLPNW